MSKRGRYRKFGPDFEPEPWYTDNNSVSDMDNDEDILMGNITENEVTDTDSSFTEELDDPALEIQVAYPGDDVDQDNARRHVGQIDDPDPHPDDHDPDPHPGDHVGQVEELDDDHNRHYLVEDPYPHPGDHDIGPDDGGKSILDTCVYECNSY